MAKHTRSGKTGYIIFDESDWASGLAPLGRSGTAFIKQTNESGMGGLFGVDPYRITGVLQPGFNPTNATNATTALAGPLLAGVFDPNSNAGLYGVDLGGRVQQINFVLNTVTNAGAYPHTIGGTSPVGQDAIIYQHNSGGTTTQVYSMFYSYYNNANWDIGAIVNFSGTPDDDFMSSVPTNPLDITGGDGDSTYQRTRPHPMCVGSDDILYIGSGRYIHGYDGGTGNNGTFISKILTLPAGFNVQAMIPYDDFLYIAGNYGTASLSAGLNQTAGDAAVYIWNYVDLDITQIINLNDPYVSTMFTWRGVPTVITYGPKERNGFIKIKHLIGNQAIKKCDLPFDVSPVLRGVDSRQNMLYINLGGYVVTVGDKFTGEGYEINSIGAATYQNLSSVASGWIYNVQTAAVVNPTIFVSSSASTNYAFSSLATGYGVSSAITQFYEPDFPPLQYGRVKGVTVYYYDVVAADAANAEYSLVLYTDYGTSTLLLNGSQSLTAPLIKKYLNSTSDRPLPFFTSAALQFIWSVGGTNAHKISKAIIEYELEDFTN